MVLFEELNARIADLQEGLQPESLRYWHNLVVSDARALAPPHLQDHISVTQDAHLPMKFRLDISKRVVNCYVMAIETHLDQMPITTRLYFLQVCQMLGAKMDSQMV